MQHKTNFSLIAIALTVFSLWFYFTPHLTVKHMKEAAETRDAAKLSSYVNFPALKDSLKGSLNAKFAAEMTAPKTNPFSTLGAAMAAALVGPMIDAFVTPESLALMMKGDRPLAQKNAKTPQQQQQQQQEDAQIERTMGYESFDRFVVTIKKKGDTSEPIGFVFNREGLFSWKLSAIRLPVWQ